ncbi:MAG: hypothetical protein EBR94_10525 [Bacteroidetes bacterium]|jgi:hypothetical protein|nr:hypothetical protein [Bacteroidota bacterium]
MKTVIVAILLFLNFTSCTNTASVKINIDGKWKYVMHDYSVNITFKNGFYNSSNHNDDLIFHSKGKYFFLENTKRAKITIVLVPDLVIEHGDTIIQNCTYLDVISATDSLIMVRNTWPFNYSDNKRNLDIEVRKVSR